jgi:hypothetical protein
MENRSDEAKLLEEFRAAAVDYGEALEVGNHKAANQAASLGGTLKKEIVARGNPTVGRLLKMLDDRNPWIRLAAAA